MQEDVRSAVPRTDHQEEDALTFRRQSPGRRCMWTSSRGSLSKNLIAAHPVQGSQADEGSGDTCSPAVRAELRDGKARKLLICGSLGSGFLGDGVWTDRTSHIWLRQGKETKATENPKRR